MIKLHELANLGQAVSVIYETLAVADIRQAADLLRPLYDQIDGLDGYVSLEEKRDRLTGSN